MLISGVTPVAGTMFLFGTLVATLLSRSALRVLQSAWPQSRAERLRCVTGLIFR